MKTPGHCGACGHKSEQQPCFSCTDSFKQQRDDLMAIAKKDRHAWQEGRIKDINKLIGTRSNPTHRSRAMGR